MNRWFLVLPVVLCACREPAPPAEAAAKDLGQATADAAADTQRLKPVTGAVNDVIRAVPDCDAVKQLIPEAQRQIDEAAKDVRTSTGQVTLQALRTQLQRAAEPCP